jgi:hypothetical protein
MRWAAILTCQFSITEPFLGLEIGSHFAYGVQRAAAVSSRAVESIIQPQLGGAIDDRS